MLQEVVRIAPLFHGTPLTTLLIMLETDQLGFSGTPVSLSRSYQVSWGFGPGDGYGGVLVLDQEKLRQNYRLSPTDNMEGVTGSAPAHTGAWEAEHEEIVDRSIRPLSRYLLSINVDPAMLRQAQRDKRWLDKERKFWMNGKNYYQNVDAVRSVVGSGEMIPRIIPRLTSKLLNNPLLNRYQPLVTPKPDDNEDDEE